MKQKLTTFFIIPIIFLTAFSNTFADTNSESYEKTFLISAYYSPLPNQNFYAQGSYEADIRMNGNGTNGADGTEVYPGMLAAPATYAFGTKMKIPGLGVGTVHDRGGAIVVAGERKQSYDRIDVWMGIGEKGLTNALNWGKREVTVTVYSPEYPIIQNFTLPGSTPNFVTYLELGDTGTAVEQLQKELKTYGYLRQKISGEFDEQTKRALLGLQLAWQIIDSADEENAGKLDEKTQTSLNVKIQQREQQYFLSSKKLARPKSNSTNSQFFASLSLGDRGDAVRELQIKLTEMRFYECEINGIYDEVMENCIFEFQKNHYRQEQR